MNTKLGRCELAVADNFYIRNGRGTNIGAQTFKVHRLAILISTENTLAIIKFKIV